MDKEYIPESSDPEDIDTDYWDDDGDSLLVEEDEKFYIPNDIPDWYEWAAEDATWD